MADVIESFQEFEKHVLHFKKNKVVVVDFWAASCNDCITLTPFFYQQVGKFPKFNFFEVDVEDVPEVKNWEKIKKLPTVKLYQHGNCIETIEGGDKNKISAALAKWNQKT